MGLLEYLLFSGIILGLAVYELISLRRYRDRDRPPPADPRPPDESP